MEKYINNLKIKLYKNKFIILNILLSFIATIGIIGYYHIFTSYDLLSNSFINVIIFVLFTNLFNKIDWSKKQNNIFSSIFSLFLSSILIIGTQLENNSSINWNIITLIKIICLTFSIIPIIYLILSFLNKYKTKSKIINYKNVSLGTFIFIVLFNIFVFLAIYPGLYGYDAGFQISEILEKNVQLTSHFSYIFCLILANTVKLGKIMFNSYQIGFAIYCFLQMLFLSFVSTKITIYSLKRTNNIYIYLFSVLLFSVFPLYTVMALSATQDSLFAGLFALVILNILDMFENKNYWKNFINPILLSILILFACMIRNNGFYTFLVSIPFIILFKKDKKWLTLLIFLIPLILYKIYSGPVYNLIGIQNTDTMGEMLSVPSQQLARVYNYNNTVFNNKDKTLLNKYYTDVDKFTEYIFRQSISDPIKGLINNNNVSNDLSGYISLWAKIGIKDPKNYTEAFLLNTLGYWYPNKNYSDLRMYHPYIEYDMMNAKFWNKKYIDIKRSSKFKAYDKLLYLTLVKNYWKKVPIISTIFTMGTYFIVFIFLIGIAILRKKWQYFIPLSIVLGLYITLFLSPVGLFRYCFPILMILPILLSLIISKNNIYLDSL